MEILVNNSIGSPTPTISEWFTRQCPLVFHSTNQSGAVCGCCDTGSALWSK